MAKKTIKAEVLKVEKSIFENPTYLKNKIAYFEKRRCSAKTPEELASMAFWINDFKKKLEDLTK